MKEENAWNSHNWTSPDTALALLVESVNLRSGVEPGMPITLLVSGTLLSGALVPAWQWYDEQGGGDDAGDDDGYNFFHKSRDRILEQNRHLRESADVLEEDWTPEQREARQTFAKFVHLKNARVFSGNMSLPEVSWRVRLGDVNAWHHGALGIEGQAPPSLE